MSANRLTRITFILAIAGALLVALQCRSDGQSSREGDARRQGPAADVSRKVVDEAIHREPPVGGENSPAPSAPPEFVVRLGELAVGDAAIRVPTGSYEAPKGGAPAYRVPGPIAAFRGPDGAWRGHGYLETYPRLLRFEGTLKKDQAKLTYEFEEGKSYKVELKVSEGVVLMNEQSDLGPRNLFVFDCYYGWQPAAGFATDLIGHNHNFLYMPCYYDKPEVTIRPVRLLDEDSREREPAAVAVLSADAESSDVVGLWCRDVRKWQGADGMGIQLWQRRQLPGDFASRHFLGPETKSDTTPNPRTAGMLGPSLYEGHVTIELSLGTGSRMLGFAVTSKGETKQSIPAAFKKLVKDHS